MKQPIPDNQPVLHTPVVRFLAVCRWLTLAVLLGSSAPLHAATLLKYNFEGSNPWTGMAGYFQTEGGTVTATPTYTTAGTIDAYGTSTASGGLQLVVDSSAATGAWSAGLDSGVLVSASNSVTNLGLLTLSFSLSASSAYPICVKIESYDNATPSVRTGGLKTLIFPAAPDFYQRYAIDLDKMTADGNFDPAATKMRIYFEIASTANGIGWPAGASHTLKVDNVNYSTPKYYVKPLSIGGSDSNDGLSEAEALATVQAATNKPLTGDNIIAIMDDGTMGGADYSSTNINNDMVNLSKPGTPDAWIVFRNYPGDTPVLTTAGWDAFRICNNSSGGSAAYVEIRGLTIRGHSYFDANGDRQINPAYQSFVGQTASQTNSNGISVDKNFNFTNLPHHIRVADNIIEFCAGANGGSGDRQSFENNIIRYNCWWMKYAGSGISFAFAADTEQGANYRSLIQNNIIYGNECMIPWYGIASKPYSDGNGIIIDSHTAGYTGKTLVQNNLVYNNGGSGIHVLKASNVDVVHNTVYMNSASTSQAYGQVFTQSTGTGPGQTVTNALVTNNIMFAGRNTTGVNSYLYNESATSVASSVAATIFHKRNIYAGGDTTPPLTGANLSDNTDLGRSYDATNLFISPSTDPAVADFRLRAAVAANNYGRAIGYRSARDHALTPRPIDGTTDTGAYETVEGLAYSPVIRPKSGRYTTAESVTMVSDTAGSTIVYTTDGTPPVVDGGGIPTNGIVYSTAIPVSSTMTVKAIAWKSGLITSPVSTAIYDYTDLSAVPIYLALDVASGTYPGTRIIQPLTRTPRAFIRFTTNGADPTPTTGTPQEYRGYSVLDHASVRYQAYKSGRADSAIVTGTYTVRAQIGSTGEGSSVIPIGANKIRFVRFQAANAMSAANIYARLAGGTGGYRAAIYSDNSSAPNTRLATSSLVSNPVTGWTVFPLSSRAALTKNSYYWLAIWSDNVTAGIYSTPTGGTVREAANNSPWPNPAGTATAVAGTANDSIYAMNQPPNLAPVVNAGANQSITLPSGASLAGTATDDGVPLAPGTLTSVWSQVSGPGTATFVNDAALATTATFSAAGTYVLRLTARDALRTTEDDVTIHVAPNPQSATNTALVSGGNPATLGAGLSFFRARGELTCTVKGSGDLVGCTDIAINSETVGQSMTMSDSPRSTPPCADKACNTKINPQPGQGSPDPPVEFVTDSREDSGPANPAQAKKELRAP